LPRGAGMRLVALLLLATLAGCIDEKNAVPPQEPQASTEPDVPRSPNVEAPAGGQAGSGGFRVEADGAAGTWLVGYHPFPAPTTSIGYATYLRLTTEGDGARDTLWIPPSPTVIPAGAPNGSFALEEWGPFHPFEEHYILRHNAALDMDVAAGVGIGHYLAMHGVIFAVGSEAPWRLELEVVWDESGEVSEPNWLSTGDGIEFVQGAQTTVPEAGGPADVVSFAWDFAQAGWHHVELLDYRLQPIGIRQHDIAFPNGWRVQGMGQQQGYWAVVMGSASSGGWLDYAGAMRDEAGTVTGQVTYAQAAATFEPVGVHIPLTVLPHGLNGTDYWGSTWPFHEPRVPIDEPPGRSWWSLSTQEARRGGAPARAA